MRCRDPQGAKFIRRLGEVQRVPHFRKPSNSQASRNLWKTLWNLFASHTIGKGVLVKIERVKCAGQRDSKNFQFFAKMLLSRERT